MPILSALSALVVITAALVVLRRCSRFPRMREADLAERIFAFDQHALVSIFDAEGTILDVNDLFCRTLGYPRQRLIGAGQDLVCRDGSRQFRDIFETIGRGQVWRGEICHRSAMDDSRWVESTVTPLRGRRRGPLRYIAVSTDITPRKRFQQELERSRVFFQEITQSIGEGICAVDPEGRCKFLNREGERLLGRTFDEARHRRLLDFIQLRASPSSEEDSLSRSIREGRRHESDDQCFIHRDGRVIPVRIVAVPLEDSGAIIGSVIVFEDVTERRWIYGELERSEQRLTMALDISLSGFWDYNPITDLAVYSETWFRMLGYEASELEGTGAAFLRLMHPDDVEPYRAAMRRHLKDDANPFEAKFRLRRRDAEWAWIRSRGKVVERDADGRVWRMIGLHIDTTAVERIQQECAESKDAAERANQAKSDFLAVMSHELRTPLNAVIGLSYLLRRAGLNARQLDYVDKIQSASKTLLALISDILDFSKMEAGKLTLESAPFNLDEVIENISDFITPTLEEKRVELVITKSKDLPVAYVGDALRLTQLLLNLLSNAGKFTEAGSIHVAIEGGPIVHDQIRLRISVADTGIGMSADQLTCLFRPFTQADASTSRRFGGTGLGLAICRQIAHLLGGEIEARSTEGVGTTFTFQAPFRLAASPGACDAEASLRGQRALIVDADPASRGVTKNALTELGVQAFEAIDGAEVLRRLDEEDSFDIVLIDERLPDMNGLEVVARLREARSRSRCMVMTTSERSRLESAIAERFGDARGVAGIFEKSDAPDTSKQRLLASLGRPRARRRRRADDRSRGAESGFADAKALLVEDNRVNQQVATELLRAIGISATVAGSGEEALKILADRRFDLILMDIQMPGMDGLAATRAIRETLGDTITPIIAMTASAMAGDRERCLAVGMNDHIAKPIDPDQLATTLRRWLRQSVAAHASPASARNRAPAPDAEAIEGPTGFDMPRALRNLAGDRELFTQMLEVFIEDHADKGDAARAAAAASDWRRVNGIAHTLKGAAGTMGASSLARVAAELEASTRDDLVSSGRDDSARGVEALALALESVVTNIKAHQKARETSTATRETVLA